MARMINLKKIMARQVVEQNSLKFEIIEKMNNLANLAQYKHKYGKICKEIDDYYEKIEAEGSKPELQQLSRREELDFNQKSPNHAGGGHNGANPDFVSVNTESHMQLRQQQSGVNIDEDEDIIIEERKSAGAIEEIKDESNLPLPSAAVIARPTSSLFSNTDSDSDCTNLDLASNDGQNQDSQDIKKKLFEKE